MVLYLDTFKDICKKILPAVDSSELSNITEIIELVVIDKQLLLKVTNKEYLVKVYMPVEDNFNFHATVNANLFLKLVSQLTTETISLETSDNYLKIKSNGDYKLPLIFDNEKLLEVPDINMVNVTNHFPIKTEILTSILNYNSKEIKDNVSNAVQRLFYVDQEGAITFMSGACVNKFELPVPVKLLFNMRLVRLFKLFKSESVEFSMAKDCLTSDIIQTKVNFKSDDIEITSILYCDNSMVESVPVEAIRNRANEIYPYSITLNREELSQTLNRLLLFNSGYGMKENIKPYGRFEFFNNYVMIHDVSGSNEEKLNYSSGEVSSDYDCYVDILNLKQLIDNSSDTCMCINFGNHQALTIVRNNIYNVIPECTVLNA